MNKMKMRLEGNPTVRINARSVFSARQEPDWVEGRVVDVLDTQFTAHIPSFKMSGEYQIVFRCYADKGRTWDFNDG